MSAKVYHTSYSSSSISELISQSSPSQGKRFPAMFDLVCIDLIKVLVMVGFQPLGRLGYQLDWIDGGLKVIKVHSGTANIYFFLRRTLLFPKITTY